MNEIKDTYRSKTLEEKMYDILVSAHDLTFTELAKKLAEIAREHYSHFIE